MAANDVPIMCKHMCMAIFNKWPGYERDKFLNSFAISRGKMVEWGYMTRGSDVGPTKNMQLTPKGIVRNRQHVRERGGAGKSREFDRLFAAWWDEGEKGAEPDRPPRYGGRAR